MLIVLIVVFMSTVCHSAAIFHSNETILFNKSIHRVDPSIAEDARLTVPEIITKYGYIVEIHHATTEDGYILELHRIVGGPKSPPSKGKKVYFLMHGLIFSSAAFVLSGPNRALAYKLSDLGYDVWLGNCRGNTYSTNHTILNLKCQADQKRFYNYSLNEIGIYDLPANIDYILKHTNETKLHYIGHSQGCTTFFIMLSEKPEYNKKIEMMHAMAPAVYLSHLKSPVIRFVASIIDSLYELNKLIGLYRFRPSEIQRKMCRDEESTQLLCERVLDLIAGDSDQRKTQLLTVIFGHLPAGASVNSFINFGQLINSGRFRKFDYGPSENLAHYGQEEPPDYNLKNAIVPVAVYYAKSDWLTVVKDVKKLIQELPNVINDYLVPHEKFNHNDFLWAMNASHLVYDEIVKTINKIDSKESQNQILNKN